MPSCGITDPGTLATASRKSSTSAVRIEVSCRQPHRSQPGPADHQRRGDAGRRDGALEGECYLVTRVVQARVADLEGPPEGVGRGWAVPDVHPEEPDSARPEMPG